jgi:S-adenosylmethionine:tRNA ribosyltransferase-isomerase
MTAALQPQLAPAIAPIESTGRERHDVALMVAAPGRIVDTRFQRFGEHLAAGDVLVVNDSATEPAALTGRHDGAPVGVHVSGPGPEGTWLVELRETDRSGPILSAAPCDLIELDHGSLALIEPAEVTESDVRLWVAEWLGRRNLVDVVRAHGSPIRYSYVPRRWPIEAYRSLFEVHRPEFSSAEMPSAARPFTPQVVRDLRRRGVGIATVTLHTGVSSLESHEPPMPERFEVNAPATAAINHARARGGRVVAVGTTSVRAIESAARAGSIVPSRGWTDLVLSPDRRTVAVDGLVTGWHPPEASHLDLIEAVVGRGIVSSAYRAAQEFEYRSHEFGDSCLLLAG